MLFMRIYIFILCSILSILPSFSGEVTFDKGLAAVNHLKQRCEEAVALQDWETVQRYGMTLTDLMLQASIPTTQTSYKNDPIETVTAKVYGYRSSASNEEELYPLVQALGLLAYLGTLETKAADKALSALETLQNSLNQTFSADYTSVGEKKAVDDQPKISDVIQNHQKAARDIYQSLAKNLVKSSPYADLIQKSGGDKVRERLETLILISDPAPADTLANSAYKGQIHVRAEADQETLDVLSSLFPWVQCIHRQEEGKKREQEAQEHLERERVKGDPLGSDNDIRDYANNLNSLEALLAQAQEKKAELQRLMDGPAAEIKGLAQEITKINTLERFKLKGEVLQNINLPMDIRIPGFDDRLEKLHQKWEQGSNLLEMSKYYAVKMEGTTQQELYRLIGEEERFSQDLEKALNDLDNPLEHIQTVMAAYLAHQDIMQKCARDGYGQSEVREALKRMTISPTDRTAVEDALHKRLELQEVVAQKLKQLAGCQQTKYKLSMKSRPLSKTQLGYRQKLRACQARERELQSKIAVLKRKQAEEG
jgi:hypothetical protein